MGKLRFRFNAAKFVSAVAYLARACPNGTKLTICKQLYFADKEHLLKYGRPITGDMYYHLKDGQIPTRGLDMLRGRGSAADNALLEKYVEVIGNRVRPKLPPDEKVFSKSDVEILDLIVKQYGKMTAHQLWKLAHEEHTYKESEEGCAIDFGLFFKGRPDAQPVKALVEEEQESRDILSHYVAAE